MTNNFRQEIKKENSLSIFNAEEISPDEARRQKEVCRDDSEQMWQIERSLLLEQLPGIENTPLWTPDLVELCCFTDRQIIRKLQSWWLVNHADMASTRTRKRIQTLLVGHTDIVDLDSRLTKLKFLVDLGIPDLIGSGEIYSAKHPTIQKIWKQVKRSRKAKSLGIAPGHNATPMQWIGRMIRDTFGDTSTSIQSGVGERDRTYRYQRSKYSGLERFIAEYLTEKSGSQSRITRF